MHSVSIIRGQLVFFIVLQVFAVEAEVIAAARVVQSASAETRSVTGNTNMTAKAGCKERCGNVSIPYPFGMGTSNCYRDVRFKINCSNFNNSPVALFNGWEVFQITPDYVRVNIQANVTCGYGNTTGTIQVSKFPFPVSNTLNKLTVLGCNIYGFISNIGEQSNPISYNSISSGCLSRCNAEVNISDITSKCSSYGCCQETIPSKLKNFMIQTNEVLLHNNGYNSTISTNDACSSAFLVDQAFSIPDIRSLKEDSFVPVILDWAITDFTTCKEAQKTRSSYVCGENTNCLEWQNGPGYRCNCSKGYQGNPYLLHGCQDVDECKELDKCGKGVICTNTLGSYNCMADDDRKFPVSRVVSLVIGTSIVTILLLWMGYRLYIRFEKKRQIKLTKTNHFARNGGLMLKKMVTPNDGVGEKTIKVFITEELDKMTNNFSTSRIIGKGGFGTVYTGVLPNGETVAIKKSKLVDENQVEQFINELVILSQINHRYIVKLLGCCLETHVPLLVYEFVSNGTLSYHLHVEAGDSESSLAWKNRVRIASEIAGALAYLHSDTSTPIFHRDIKSTNILLDENYKVKVSDFGISRSIHRDETHLTTLVQGTFGYLDPEYFSSSQFTDKSDVYSFGVILVELLTGEKAISKTRFAEQKSLALYFVKSMEGNRLSEILDARVCHEGSKDDVLLVAQLAKKCLNIVGKKRPTMKEVSLTLAVCMRNFQEIPCTD
ncbi:hypothetical protein C5167_000092 [Papaver somniferum]|uniref:Protein kinase domain-containing protein n=1 Tax=Papaver somniferum TaxID=3469 RepID=A0A4Y7KSB9_PAPSO|nr:wall-associated receptor kinase-like 6 [Papaver somniferum]RZC75746.1 hypothetical protein C5167_000092 [Papaver somniferum]